ncbi:MAG TPA: XdhC/CoxI family protein [Chitinophagaceae bacterium]|jgi:xanthine/CO dehydrogenase XdhC/CoxF family maturation factor|nr:XdhC/CoxI family protein [Chitinophagaceae bacterium]
MKEIHDIIMAFDEAQKLGKRTALATVVHVDGSSYRRPGARMLIREDGQLTGAISGGCLERDALQKALLVMMQQKCKLVTYDTNDEDDAKLGMGLGCNGIIQVLIEPVDISDQNNPIQFLKAIISKRQQNVLITLFSLQNKRDAQYGTCLLVSEDGMVSGDAPVLTDILITDAKKALVSKNSSFKNYITENNNLTAFIELIKPSISIVIIGAGNDAMPLVKMADILGWETTVVDGRADYAKKERFSPACKVLVSKPENVLDKLTVDDQTVFLLMTHNYNYDLAMLRALLSRKVAYIGSLGPRKKLDRMIDELKEEGVSLNSERLSALYGPVGLDIGAETSEEIALSILAEIKAVFSSKSAQSLRTNSDVIHSRSDLHVEQVDVRGQ